MLGKVFVIIEVVAEVLLSAMCVVVGLTIADRFIFRIGFAWSEELARVLLIWCSLMSACVVVSKKGHFVVSYFVEKLLQKEGRISQFLYLFICVWSCLILFILLVKGFELTISMYDTFTPGMGIRQSWFYSSIPICSCIMIVFFFSEIYTSFRHLKKGVNKK
jgi:TRAP-type C4-dicarboxylate transport system permease small subunit